MIVMEVINNMKCPFRKITNYQYKYSANGSGSHLVTRTEEEFSYCYGDNCPFFYTDEEDIGRCNRCGSVEEGDDI